jgi:adenylate cyclase
MSPSILTKVRSSMEQFRRGASFEAAVREELTRLLESPHLDASGRLRELLKHIVEETVAGRSERLNQAAIAISVFGRGSDFDAVLDPIVRLQAGRLRRSLERYYRISGDSGALRIELPKGAYAATFARCGHAQSPTVSPASCGATEF